ncbi:hypothetical protein [uncultured Ferrimonas sp.]|uniref:hypothetical protein n=1 Tax=uncultured Ferrimonas sp. TaxID=432640 RepID=UPI0026201216|nr:hypothetical protein [uncultured Ferrimonas sp.]
MTPFEQEVVASVLWQLQGYRKGVVTLRVTTRILRATLRRIKPKLVGRSAALQPDEAADLDHAIPLKVVVAKLLEWPGDELAVLSALLQRYLVAVELTQDQHRRLLKEAGLASDMPPQWDGNDVFARYHHVGISIDS